VAAPKHRADFVTSAAWSYEVAERRRFAAALFGSAGEHRLIGAASRANMGRHIMKTTVEIADDLFERAQRLARKERTTFRSLTEQGLRLVLKAKEGKPKKLPPLLTVGGGGLRDEFKNAAWEKIRDEIYRGHGG
jgi:hypothetical protein